MEQRISIERMEQAVNIFGSFDENIRLIEAEFHVTITNREGELRINGEPEDTMLAAKAINALLTLSAKGEPLGEQQVRYVIGLARSGQEGKISELTQDVICITAKGRPVKPKTIGQKHYCDSISRNTVTIGVGPAGTGKTYLAVAEAGAALRPKEVNRIVCCSTCWGRRRTINIWSGATSRWRPWPTCGAGPWTTASSFWMRPRTPAGSR